MSELAKNIAAILQGVTLAATLWTAGYVWSVEHRLLRLEYALGVEKIPTIERSNGYGR